MQRTRSLLARVRTGPLLLLVCTSAQAQVRTDVFDVRHRDEVLGRIDAQRVVEGDRTTYSMISHSTFHMVWTQEVHTVVRSHYVSERVVGCISTVHVNEDMRDSSALRTVAGRGLYFVHPGNVYGAALPTNPWTTSRMYYDEPIGLDSIFVESDLREYPLVALGPGEYLLKLDNKHSNHYIYRNGRLMEVRVDRGWLELVFRRVS